MQEETSERGSSLRWYFGIILHWAWLLILVPVVCGALAYAGSQMIEPVYEARTTFYIKEPASSRGNELAALTLSERQATTYAQLITSQPILEQVIQKLNLPMRPATLKGQLEVQPVRQTALINLSARDTDRVRAEQIANTTVEVFANQQREEQAQRYAGSLERLSSQMEAVNQQIAQTQTALNAIGDTADERAQRDRLTTTLNQYQQSESNLLEKIETIRITEAETTATIRQTESATARQVSPRVLYNTLLVFLISLGLAVAGVFLKETLDDTVKDPEELSRYAGLPILGYVAKFKGGASELIVISEPRAPISEAFRTLRTNIQFASVDRPIRKLVVTSSSPGEGKSTVASNLGAVMAQSGRRVTLVEADLRRPTLHKKFKLLNRIGISDLFMQSEVRLDGAVQTTDLENLSVLPSGELPPNPAELLGSEKMREILHRVEEQSDMVLIDSPPVLAVTDAMVLSQRVDGVLLVVRAGVTKLSAVKHTVEQLRFVKAHVIGIVINDIQLRRSRYGYSYYGYHYAYQEDEIKGSERKRGRRSPASAIEGRG